MSGTEETWWRFDHWFKLMGVIVGAMLIVEGAVCIFYLAAPNLIAGFLLDVMVPFGAHLILIGLFLVSYWALKGTSLPLARLTENRWVSLVVLLAGALLVIESLLFAYYLSCHYSYPGYVREFWIMAAAAQLFVLGMMTVLGWLSKDPDEVRTGWARIIAYLFSSIIAAQGLFVMGAAVPVDMEGIGVITAGTLALFGLQLFVVSLTIAIVWGFKDKLVFGRRPFSHWLVLDIPLLLAEVLAIEGILLVVFAAPITPSILGVDQLGKWVMVLVGAQIFFLATMCAVAWFWIGKRAWESKPVSVIGVTIGTALVTEGVFVMGAAAPMVVESVGGVLARTVSLAGAQLLIIGLFLVLYWLSKDRMIFGRDITANRVVSLVPMIAGAIVAMEGVILVAYASPVVVEGLGGIRAVWMTLAGTQLFFLGGATAMMWYWRDRPRTEAPITWIAEPLIAWVVVSQGLFIMGISDTAYVDGIGGILGRTVAIGGAQLFLLALAALGLRFLSARGVMGRQVKGIPLSELVSYLVWGLVAVEGLAIMVLSANVTIEGLGSISMMYITLAGAQLSLLALLGMTFLVWRNKGLTLRKSRYLALGILFLLLLLPPAFIF